MNISVIGTGYVGLVTGACFAETGLTVTCVDIDKEKIDNLKKGIIPIYEPGLDIIVKKNIEKKSLFFSTSIAEGIKNSEVVFIAVGTPPDEDGSADLTHVLKVAEEIANNINNYIVIVNKSTVPVGTGKKVKKLVKNIIDKRGLNIEFDIVSNPEFLKEGNAIEDFMRPDRIVIGVENERAKKVMEKLYHPFILNNHPIIFMDVASAELTKYAANAMLATRISFMNEISRICELVGADINMIRKGIGSDPRIGNKFLYAGIGYGGSCFPKDVKALIKTSEELNYDFKILKSVEEINYSQRHFFISKILKHYKNHLSGKTLTIWGLSFKPNTDDMREAPSITVINELLKNNVKINAYDPVALKECQKIFGNKINYYTDKYEALKNSSGLILITEWNEFRLLNYNLMKSLMKELVIFDGRNIYDPQEIIENGFTYYSIGRKNSL